MPFVLALFSTLPRFRCVSICSLTARHYPCFPSGPSLHWPLAATRRLYHRQFSGRRGAGHRRGDAKHHPHSPDILSLRQDCPNSASVSGSCSLLDGTSALVVGSFCLNQPHQDFLMNSRLRFCVFAHVRPPQPVHGASGNRTPARRCQRSDAARSWRPSPILTSPTEFRACVFSTLSHSRIRIYDHFSLDIAGPQLYTEAQSIEGVASAMRYIEDPRQERLFDPYQGLFPPLARRILENGWQGTFRLAILETLPVGKLSEHFHPSLGTHTKELY